MFDSEQPTMLQKQGHELITPLQRFVDRAQDPNATVLEKITALNIVFGTENQSENPQFTQRLTNFLQEITTLVFNGDKEKTVSFLVCVSDSNQFGSSPKTIAELTVDYKQQPTFVFRNKSNNTDSTYYQAQTCSVALTNLKAANGSGKLSFVFKPAQTNK